MRRKSIAPSRTPLRRRRSPQKRTNTCLDDVKQKQPNDTTDHKTKYTTRSISKSHHHTRMQRKHQRSPLRTKITEPESIDAIEHYTVAKPQLRRTRRTHVTDKDGESSLREKEVKTTRKEKAPHEKIPTTYIQHPSSSTLTAKAATPQQPNPPPIPPTDYDPSCFDGHNHTHFNGSNTDIKTLRAKVPVLYANTLDDIQQRLRSMLGMHEVTTVPDGPVINLHLKGGTAQVLHEAQEKLCRMFKPNIFEEQDIA